MAPTGQEEEERTRAAVVMALHKARAIRGSITRYIQQFDKAASAFNRDTSSKRALELMENIASTITQKYSEVDECYIKVQTLVIDQEYMTNHEPTLQQELSEAPSPATSSNLTRLHQLSIETLLQREPWN